MHFGCIHGHSCPKEKPVPYNRGCGCLDVSIRLGDGGVVVGGGGGVLPGILSGMTASVIRL